METECQGAGKETASFNKTVSTLEREHKKQTEGKKDFKDTRKVGNGAGDQRTKHFKALGSPTGITLRAQPKLDPNSKRHQPLISRDAT